MRFPLPIPSRISEALGERVPVDLEFCDLAQRREKKTWVRVDASTGRRVKLTMSSALRRAESGGALPQGPQTHLQETVLLGGGAVLLFGALMGSGLQQSAPVAARY